MNEREEIMEKLCERYKSFCISGDAQLRWFSFTPNTYDAFMNVDFGDMTVEVYNIDKATGKFTQEKTKILSYYAHNNYKTIIKIIDDELKEYYEIIERYKQYLITISFDKVAWFGLNKYIGEYSFMSMDEDNVHIFKPKIFSRNNRSE